MPYVTLPLLKKAIAELEGKHPLLVLVLPAMVRAGVQVVRRAQEGRPYGSTNELAVLDEFFRIAGAPAGTPYRAIWEEDAKNHWRDVRYAGRALQRMRTDRVSAGAGFTQMKARPADLWGLRANAGPELSKLGKVRIVDLAIWYGRSWDVPDVDALVERFQREVPLDLDKLVGAVYEDGVPPEYRELPLAAEPLTPEELAEATGAAAPPPNVGGDLDAVVTDLERRIRDQGYHLADGFVRRVVAAWLRGDIVVLVGPGGTGKTRFAEVAQRALGDLLGGLRASWVTVRPEFDETEFIGYERLDGKLELRDVATQVLKSEEPLAPHLIVLEEFNLALVERYLSSILSATEDPQRRVPLPGGQQSTLPVDTLIIATCNSYVDEPETRTRLSAPTKRRATIIGMPNVLAERVDRDGDDAIAALAVDMIRQEREDVERRRRDGLATTFDTIRAGRLGSVQGPDNLAQPTRDRLIAISKAVLNTPEGREFFTMGLLRDIALALAYAGRSEAEELSALGQQIADKVLHQLRGPGQRSTAVLQAARGLPNYAEIERLIQRMRGPGDEIIPLV